MIPENAAIMIVSILLLAGGLLLIIGDGRDN